MEPLKKEGQFVSLKVALLMYKRVAGIVEDEKKLQTASASKTRVSRWVKETVNRLMPKEQEEDVKIEGLDERDEAWLQETRGVVSSSFAEVADPAGLQENIEVQLEDEVDPLTHATTRY